MIDPTPEEIAHRDAVLDRMSECILLGKVIAWPTLDEDFEFAGNVGGFRYCFEGEEDLLHLVVSRQDLKPMEEGQGLAVAQFLMPNVAPSLVWLRPGEFEHHLYLGHDDLLG